MLRLINKRILFLSCCLISDMCIYQNWSCVSVSLCERTENGVILTRRKNCPSGRYFEQLLCSGVLPHICRYVLLLFFRTDEKSKQGLLHNSWISLAFKWTFNFTECDHCFSNIGIFIAYKFMFKLFEQNSIVTKTVCSFHCSRQEKTMTST